MILIYNFPCLLQRTFLYCCLLQLIDKHDLWVSKKSATHFCSTATFLPDYCSNFIKYNVCIKLHFRPKITRLSTNQNTKFSEYNTAMFMKWKDSLPFHMHMETIREYVYYLCLESSFQTLRKCIILCMCNKHVNHKRCEKYPKYPFYWLTPSW